MTIDGYLDINLLGWLVDLLDWLVNLYVWLVNLYVWLVKLKMMKMIAEVFDWMILFVKIYDWD